MSSCHSSLEPGSREPRSFVIDGVDGWLAAGLPIEPTPT